MAQPRRNTIDLRVSSTAALNQPRSELTVTICPGHDPSLKPIPLLVRDTHHLRSVLAECKRLKQLSAANYDPGATPIYSWLFPYATIPVPSVLSVFPPDLRHSHRSSNSILSPASAGQPGDDVLDISVIREDWIKNRVHQEIFVPASQATLKVRLGTFNVNGKLPSQDLSPWVQGISDKYPYIPPLNEISPFSIEKDANDYVSSAKDQESVPQDDSVDDVDDDVDNEEKVATSTSSVRPPGPQGSSYLPPLETDDPDLLVLGFQELDLSTGALLYSSETVREDAWCTAALAGLGEKAEKYQKLASKQLVGMLILVIAKKDVVHLFSDIKTASVGVGIMGVMVRSLQALNRSLILREHQGNKGATALRLTYTPSPTPNLPYPRPTVITFVNSHLAAFDEMYDRRNSDFQELSKRLLFDSGIPQDSEMQEDGYAPPTIPLTVFQSDLLFWMGPDGSIYLSYCSLISGEAFVNFQEHRISGLPSGALSDGLGYDVKRKPAWTDRILHMPSQAAVVESLRYSSHPEITMSDHRPVSADCRVHIPLVDLDQLESFVGTLWREVADIEQSEDAPRIHVKPSTVDFGNVFYKRRVSKDLELKNIGKVASAFRFVPITAEAPTHSEWLQFNPMSGLVLPGESLSVTLSILVDNAVATRLNAGSGRMEDTLILHTSLGKDYFISVSGQYQRTCFATPLERLVRHREHVRSPASLELLSEEQALSAPQEVMRVVNWLMTNAAEIDSLFMEPGQESMIGIIRECLDTGTDFPPRPQGDVDTALSFASCLLELLDALPEPVVPRVLHSRCAQVTTRDEAFEVLDNFSSASVNVWISVTAFLHYICHRGTPNPGPQRAERIAEVLTPVLMRDDPRTAATPTSPIGKRRFLMLFIA
ncbi:hypothetical protein NLI96_g5200 [Meripilus lineatus]|uniref:Rho-GAP domain-containing protein n=1 Tax=Meripilus lineatus TaxID=2056292 RepID=A0AAD5YF00_9APHY|nr:hypothetical protein NLI96_g5200 [Physisporinus lineatus]